VPSGGQLEFPAVSIKGGTSMIDEVVSKSEIQAYVSAMREQLAAGHLDGPAKSAARAIGASDEDARTAVLSRMPDPANLKQSSGGDAPGAAFIARDAITSLLQSELDKKFREAGIVQDRSRVSGIQADEHVVREHSEEMGPRDRQWVNEVATAVVGHYATVAANGSHQFNKRPALHEITSDNPRVIVVGDWGSGTKYAKEVAALMRKQIEQAGERPVAVIHLGDVYFCGLKDEYDSNVIPDDCWPVTAAQARAGVTSWSLNGNHDMYSGAWCYFDHLLAGDARFANQRADGNPTSFFRLRTPTWDLVGLDTAWQPEVVVEGPNNPGEYGVLEDPQPTQVATWADEAEKTGRALMLLTHHQFLSAFPPEIGPCFDGGVTLASDLKDKLGPVLDAGRVRAWLWGHEHRCVGFEDFTAQQGIGIAYPRCLGHGGWQQRPPGSSWKRPRGVRFLALETDPDDGNVRRGFAVLDFADDGSIAVTYYDDSGKLSPPPETFTRA
jgi:hypothetical protein